MEPGDHERNPVVTVVVIDDEFPYRRGMHAILGLFPTQIRIIGEASTMQDAIAQVEALRPDVALVDLRLPPARGLDDPPRSEHGITAIRRIRASAPDTRILVLSHKEEPPILYAAIKAGAHGYIAKRDLHHDDNGTRLAGIVRDVAAGNGFFGPAIAPLIRQALADEHADDPPPEQLTPREREVLNLLVQDFGNRGIAQSLTISEKTVKTHVSSILAKLHAKDRTEAALIARLSELERGAG